MKFLMRFILVILLIMLAMGISGSLLSPFHEFKVLSNKMWGYCYVGLSILLALVFNVLCLKKDHKKTKSELKLWFDMHSNNIYLTCIIASFCLYSLKSELILESQELKEFISLQWMIFGISMTILLVWNVLAMKPLKKTEPQSQEKQSKLLVAYDVEQKIDYLNKVQYNYASITMIIINTVVIILASAFVYVYQLPKIFTQNVVIISFYFCTNTMCMLFMNIIEPIITEKLLIFKKLNVSSEELKIYNEVRFKLNKAANLIDILENTTLSEEDKIKIEKTIYEGLELYEKHDYPNKTEAIDTPPKSC